MRYVEFGVKYAPDDREPWVENAASEADANGLVRIHEKLDPRLHASVVQRTVDRGEWQ